MAKQGTPTMGGSRSSVAAFVGWLVAHIRRDLPFSDQAMIVWVGVLFMALMGFLDDCIKVRKRHNRGIFWKQKNYITMVAELRDGLVARRRNRHLRDDQRSPGRTAGFEVPTVVWVVWAGVIIWATTNAVNVTDGLDGLAGRIGADGLRRLHDHRVLGLPQPRGLPGRVVNPLDMGVFAAGVRRWRASASCGGTPPRLASSWATSARSRSARRWRFWRSR